MWLLNPVTIINSLPYVLIVTTLLGIYNYAWENPRIEKEARSGYVLQAEATAAKAELDERNRQAAAAILAAKGLKDAIEADKAEDAASLAQREKELDDYEEQLKTEKRSCPLTDADINWLRKNPGRKTR